MNKIVELKDGNKIIIDKTPGYCCDTVMISKGYLDGGEVLKTITLSIWDDMSFHAYSVIDDIDTIEFSFDINDPLYFCLNTLLNGDKEFIVDDDDTREVMQKYMIVKKEEDCIKIIFNNNKKLYDISKFNVFIKNIGPDARSKIDDFNIKLRLVNFFRDCENVLLEEYHQITMDEYIETVKQKRFTKKI